VDDLDRIAFFQKDILMSVTGNDISVKFHNDSAGANPEFLKKLRDAEAACDFFFFAVNLNDHANKKTVSDLTTQVAGEYGL